MTTAALDIYRAAWRAAFRPDPLLTVSEWSERFRVLSSRASAEPGQWRNARTPYLAEIMDALSAASPIERVIFMKGAQIGATEAGNNWLGYIIDQAPGPALMVLPTVETAKRNSKQRIAPLIEETPVLRAKVKDARRRDSGNTVLSKEFPGGILIMTGANSAIGLRSMPARYLFLDEVDAYPPDADGEGDPIDLAIQRTRTFARRKIFMVSTPTIQNISRIEAAYAESDQRKFWVPCPECGMFQVLKWPNVRWPKGRPADAGYACDGCGVVIPERAKATMLAGGEWRAEAPSDGKTAGFHLSALYSPGGWYSWGQAAADFLKAKGSPERLKSWVNLCLGEVWAERGEAPDWERLRDRAEPYPIGTVPPGGLTLTAGADVQGRRIEVEIVAWGPGMESWSVDYRILLGDVFEPTVWCELAELLGKSFPAAGGGLMKIGRLAIDAGYATQMVYAFSRRYSARQVMAVKGVARASLAIGSPSPVDVTAGGRKLKASAKVWPVGVDILKGQLYGWLRQPRPDLDAGESYPPGFCHFPEYGAEWFKMLTAEQLVTRRNRKGYIVREWEKTRERNEALDTRVYAMAAAMASGCERWPAERWAALAADLGATAATPGLPLGFPDGRADQPANLPVETAPTAQGVIRSRWMSS
ncbi:MAG: phage terminase large subunit family protein [Alphaproteobacteria bacterium]